MSYNEDPDMLGRAIPPERNYTGWIVAGVATLMVVFGIMFMLGRDDGPTNTASTSPSRPQVGSSGPASSPPPNPGTTGAGSTSPPPAPASR